jgi:hypothetical protein
MEKALLYCQRAAERASAVHPGAAVQRMTATKHHGNLGVGGAKLFRLRAAATRCSPIDNAW